MSERRKPVTTASDALGFISDCINEMEGDGFQTWEEKDGSVADGVTPDEHYYVSNTEYALRFGEHTFKVKVTKASK